MDVLASSPVPAPPTSLYQSPAPAHPPAAGPLRSPFRPLPARRPLRPPPRRAPVFRRAGSPLARVDTLGLSAADGGLDRRRRRVTVRRRRVLIGCVDEFDVDADELDDELEEEEEEVYDDDDDEDEHDVDVDVAQAYVPDSPLALHLAAARDDGSRPSALSSARLRPAAAAAAAAAAPLRLAHGVEPLHPAGLDDLAAVPRTPPMAAARAAASPMVSLTTPVH